MTSILVHTRRPNCQKISVKHLDLCFSWFYFFSFWGDEMHVFHIAPFRATIFVPKPLRWLEVSNRVRNWNNFKIFNYVVWKLILCQLEIPVFIYKLMCHSSLINSVSFVFCEFKGVASKNEGKTIILIRSSIQIPK